MARRTTCPASRVRPRATAATYSAWVRFLVACTHTSGDFLPGFPPVTSSEDGKPEPLFKAKDSQLSSHPMCE